jgi:hypothetical protein
MADSAESSPERSRPALWAGTAIMGLIMAATILLWAHYGTAVFFAMIASGIASCF